MSFPFLLSLLSDLFPIGQYIGKQVMLVMFGNIPVQTKLLTFSSGMKNQNQY